MLSLRSLALSLHHYIKTTQLKAMKKLSTILTLCVAGFILTGCHQKKEDSNIIAQKAVKKVPSAPVRMQDYTQTKEVEFAGTRLSCVIKRTPNDSLPMVTDENGQKYVDNIISLTVTRADGSTFLKRTFTKKSFDECLDEDYRATGILEGFVFYHIEDGYLCFAASVCHPQNDDEFIPLVVKVSATGGVTIARDTQIDTNGNDADENKEEDDDSN